MDRWFGGPRTKKAELATEKAMEKKRLASGTDVVVETA